MKKRIVSILMVSAMVVSLAACGAKDTNDTPNSQNTESTQVTPDTQDTQDTQTGETQGNETENSGEENADTMGQAILADFLAKVQENPQISNQELADALVANERIQFAPATMPVEEGYLAGFSEEIHGFSEAVTFGPMIGTIPFVGYVFTVSDGGDVDAFVENLKNTADMRWNICTEADEMVVQAEGNRVFFVMCRNNEEE